MILRDYQEEFVSAVLRDWETVDLTLAVCPTGAGKTIFFAEVIRRRLPGRALVIAHREELIFQACDKIKQVTGLVAGVEMGEFRVNVSMGIPSVVVATVQTLTAGGDGSGRLGKFAPDTFDTIIIDEAHHATSDSYRRVIEYFRQNPRAKFLGVTATPDRTDEQAMGTVFESVAKDYEILDAIHDGWLVYPYQQFISVSGLDYSKVRTTAGDLNGADLARVVEDERALHGMVGPAIELLGDRRAIMFTATVVQAERMAEIFNRHRSGMADWICGATPSEIRRDRLGHFTKGNTQVMCNCAVLLEGYDHAEVEVIFMGRATESRALYAQVCGRALRTLPGVVDGLATREERKAAIAASKKPSALIVDFVGNSGKHKLVNSSDILGGNYDIRDVEAAVRYVEKTGKPVRMDEAIRNAFHMRQAELRRREAARLARLIVGVKYEKKEVDAFAVFGIEPARECGWDLTKQLSAKQAALLEKHLKIDPASVTYSQGRQLINELFRRWDHGLCSYKQARILQKRGLDGNMTREAAAAEITKIAEREHWGQWQ